MLPFRSKVETVSLPSEGIRLAMLQGLAWIILGLYQVHAKLARCTQKHEHKKGFLKTPTLQICDAGRHKRPPACEAHFHSLILELRKSCKVKPGCSLSALLPLPASGGSGPQDYFQVLPIRTLQPRNVKVLLKLTFAAGSSAPALGGCCGFKASIDVEGNELRVQMPLYARSRCTKSATCRLDTITDSAKPLCRQQPRKLRLVRCNLSQPFNQQDSKP